MNLFFFFSSESCSRLRAKCNLNDEATFCMINLYVASGFSIVFCPVTNHTRVCIYNLSTIAIACERNRTICMCMFYGYFVSRGKHTIKHCMPYISMRTTTNDGWIAIKTGLLDNFPTMPPAVTLHGFLSQGKFSRLRGCAHQSR